MGKTSDKTVYKTTGHCGFGSGSNTAAVDVKDGRIARIRPLHLDDKYTEEELNPWKLEVRGHTLTSGTVTTLPPFAIGYKKRVYSKNRVPYPLKRVDWDPNGERNPQNRGISGYERISWDEAAQICADEIRRVIDTYGNPAVFCQGDGHGETKIMHGGHGCNTHLMNLLGGFTLQARQPDSWEGWYWGAKHMWGMDPVGQQAYQSNLLWDISENADAVICVGCDPETTPWGWGGQMASKISYFWSEIGIKQIYICPDLNYGAAIHADIKALAHYWATHKVSTVHCNGGGYIRSCFSTEPARLEIALLAMQGVGKPGQNMFKMMEWGIFGMNSLNPLPHPEWGTFMWAGFTGHVAGTDLINFIPQTLVPEAILGDYDEEHPLTWYGRVIAGLPREDQFTEWQYPMKGDPRIHMIWTDTPCWSTCWNGGNRMQEALRSPEIEFYLVQHPWMENDTMFGDIILPISTKFEEHDIVTSSQCGENDMVVLEEKAVEEVGEAKSDAEAVLAIAEKLGMADELWEHWVYPPMTATLGEQNAMDGKEAMGDAVQENVTSTEHVFGEPGFDSLQLRSYTLGGCQEHMPYGEFLEKGYLPIRFMDEDKWKAEPIGMRAFYEDPENNPLATPTGKIEFYSTGIAQVWGDDGERPPVPKWIEESEAHHERLTNDRGKDYPFLMMSNHPRWRVHAEHDDITWLREIETCKVTGPDGYKYEPVWINPVDARRLGIKDGDIVRIFNERGSVLGGAYVTERIRPSVISQDHGARVDSIVTGMGGLDRGGAVRHRPVLVQGGARGSRQRAQGEHDLHAHNRRADRGHPRVRARSPAGARGRPHRHRPRESEGPRRPRREVRGRVLERRAEHPAGLHGVRAPAGRRLDGAALRGRLRGGRPALRRRGRIRR